MSIIINGTTLGSSVSINGTSLGTIKFNGTTVFTSAPPYYNELKNGTKLTETQWLAFLDGGGIKYVISKGEQSTFRGKKITISNSVTSKYSTWIIADFNHDNTSNTCDVVQANTVYTTQFDTSTVYYSDSSVRTWLNDTYYNRFSTNIRNKLQPMSVFSDNYTLYDKVKLLSFTEVNGSAGSTITIPGDYPVEGSQYPIFTDNNSRKRTGSNTFWWLRSRFDSGRVWRVYDDGSVNISITYVNYGVVPAIRFA